MSDLQALSALDGILVPGRYGKPEGEPGVTAAERRDLGLATIEVRKGQEGALGAAVQRIYGASLPRGPRSTRGERVRFIGVGPGQWFAVSAPHANEALAEDLAAKLKGLASVADHSSGRAVLRLQGPAARAVLAKGLAIDLDPRAFGEDAAAASTIGHMGVLLWRDGAAYEIAVFRSLGGSFWAWLRAAAGEAGLAVVTTS